MVLSSTLIIDTCESSQRTEANHHATWFARSALAAGPMAGLLVYDYWGFDIAVLLAVGCALLTLMLIRMVTFPFRTPEEHLHVASLDRFFLTHGTVLFLQLTVISMVVGMLLSLPLSWMFYGFVAAGFVLSLFAQRFVFAEAELKSEIISGLILLLAAQMVYLVAPASWVSPTLTGLGVGLVGSRFLLFFIKLSRHCQRGTAQSTFFLAWECGLALGIGLGYGQLEQQTSLVLQVSLVITVAALLFYHFFTHNWYIKHKNR
jgi:hypothetical protein